MNELSIQLAIFAKLVSSHHHICPNLTPPGWFECDVFAITNAGYMHEFEIKLTKQDFKKDAEKSGGWRAKAIGLPAKYARIENRDEQGPSRFYYVLPEGIVDSADVPEWAGIHRATSGRFGVVLRKEREAKIIHKKKVEPLIIERVSKTFYWRMWSAKKSLSLARKKDGSMPVISDCSPNESIEAQP